MDEKFCLIDCSGILLALPVMNVLRIEPAPLISPMPQMRPSMSGIFLFDEEWVPVLHLDKIIQGNFDFRQDDCCRNRKYVLVCAGEQGYVGLPCDRAVKIVPDHGGQVTEHAPPTVPGCTQDFIYQNQRYPILEIERLLPLCP